MRRTVSERPITDRVSPFQPRPPFSGETGENPTQDLEVFNYTPAATDLLLGLMCFRKACKKAIAALSPIGLLRQLSWAYMSEQSRPAHKLVASIRSYLEYRLASRRSYLAPGILAWRWDEQVVTLNHALNFLNQAQLCGQPCACPYCAGAPFYGQKKTAASVVEMPQRKTGS
jgi:hypothetical protein